MGNCLTSNQIQEQEETIEPPMPAVSRSEVKKNVDGEKKIKKKTVSFKLKEESVEVEEEGLGCSNRDDAMRIVVVLTKEELKRILNCKRDFKHTSLEEFVNGMTLRERVRIREARTSDGGLDGNWRPTLESIPEDL